MLSDTLDKKFWHRIKSKFTWLCHKHIRTAHQKVGAIYGFKNVFMIESMDACHLTGQCLFCKLCCCLKLIKVLGCHACHFRDILGKIIPDILVISDIDIKGCLVVLDHRKQIFDNGCKDLFLCACTTDGKKETHWCSLCLSCHSRIAICLDIRYQFMIDIMSGVDQIFIWHLLADLIAVHAVTDKVAHVSIFTLDGMYTSLCEMQCHWPVVRNGIDNVFHACMNGCLCRPYVCTDRDILWHIAVNRSHQFCILLIGCIVLQLTEGLIVGRLPDQFVKECIF